MLVVIKGAGDIATGVACRLKNAGFDVCMLETAIPTTVRRSVAFSRCVYEKKATVEGIEAALALTISEVKKIIQDGKIPVLVDENADSIKELHPHAVVDAIIAKKNIGTKIDDAGIVIGLGPGFIAKQDCHAVIETNRGHDLGRCIYEGSAEPNTGIPGNIAGYTTDRIIRGVTAGKFMPVKKIGDFVQEGDVIARIDTEEIRAKISGVIRGLLQDGVMVEKGMKAGDIDPRGNYEHCFTVSDKARAIAGGVLEAILFLNGQKNSVENNFSMHN